MVQRCENHWARLESVIKWSDMNTNHFALHIGLLRSESLYRIKRGDNGISRRLAELIVTAFPEVNLAWLISGAGEMLTPEATRSLQVNFYDLDIETNIGRLESIDPSSTIMIPHSIEADLAMVYKGSAMTPQIPTNSIVIVKRVETESIIWGREYLVVTDKIATLRLIRAHNDETKLRLAPHNTLDFDDITISRGEIKELFVVSAKLIVNY